MLESKWSRPDKLACRIVFLLSTHASGYFTAIGLGPLALCLLILFSDLELKRAYSGCFAFRIGENDEDCCFLFLFLHC